MKRVGASSNAELESVVKRVKKDRSFWTDSIKPEYVIEGGFRRVQPYYFEYRTFAKERWLGKSVLEVFKKEFRDRCPEYYVISVYCI